MDKDTMRNLTFGLLVALTACVSTRGQNVSYRSSLGPDDAFTCVVQSLGEMDFTIRDTNRESGLIVAESQEQLYALGTGQVTNATLTVNVLPPAEGSGSQLQMTREGVSEESTEKIRDQCQG